MKAHYWDNLNSDPSKDYPLPLRLHTLMSKQMSKGNIIHRGDHLVNTVCLIWIVSGRCRVLLNGSEAVMEKDHVFYALYRETFQMECLSGECSFWELGFFGPLAEAVILAYRYPRFMIAEKDPEPLWREIMTLGPSNNAFDERRLAAVILDILAHAAGPDSLLNPEERLLDQGRYLINRHLDDPALGVEFLVERLAVSRSRLNGIFTRYLKVSPGRHILDRRLVRAYSLLRGTDFPIGKVAAMCGFRDPKTFSRFIRRSSGMGPMDYRKQSRLETGLPQ